MKRVLIVSPHFPPLNAADMHRVRTSLRHYEEFGWQPFVLAVDPADQTMPLDPSLVDTLPEGLHVSYASAVPLRLTRVFGIGNAGLRAFASLYQRGADLIRQHGIDLVYFSTTQFLAMPLGRLWKYRCGVPYVLDFQDPWFTTYYDDKPQSERPPKHRVARTVHRVLEAWTMRKVDGVIAVSHAYTETLRARYPWVTQEMCTTIPFGAAESDFDGLEAHVDVADGHNAPHTKCGVYIGRGGPDMATALRILFRALHRGRATSHAFEHVALSFIGTDYAPPARAKKTVEPVAALEHVGDQVSETTSRIPYRAALGRLRAADFLVLIGSDDAAYSPSKVYPYILARRPLIAIVHEKSPIADLVRKTHAGIVITFAGRDDIDRPATMLVDQWRRVLDGEPHPDVDWTALEPYTARRLTERQCLAFNAAILPRCVRFQPCPD